MKTIVTLVAALALVLPGAASAAWDGGGNSGPPPYGCSGNNAYQWIVYGGAAWVCAPSYPYGTWAWYYSGPA